MYIFGIFVFLMEKLSPQESEKLSPRNLKNSAPRNLKNSAPVPTRPLRIRVPFFPAVYLSREPSPKKGVRARAPIAGGPRTLTAWHSLSMLETLDRVAQAKSSMVACQLEVLR